MAPSGTQRTKMVFYIIIVLSFIIRWWLVPLFADDPTHSNGRTVIPLLMYTPHDIKWVLWGNILVRQDLGLYGYVDQFGRHYAYGPLLAYLAWGWSRVFGPSIVSTKMLFVAGDLIALLFVYGILVRLRNMQVALQGAAMYSFSAIPLFVGAVRGKEEPLVAAFMLMAIFFLFLPRKHAPALAAIAAALSFAIKPTIIFILPPLGIYLLQKREPLKTVSFGVFFALVSALLLSVEWSRSGTLAYTHISEHTGYVYGLTLFNLPNKLYGLSLQFPGRSLCGNLANMIQNYPIISITFPLLYAALLGTLYAKGKRHNEELLLKACAVALILSAIIKSVTHSHYLYWSFPFIVMVVAINGRSISWPKAVIGALVTTISLTWFSITYRESTPLELPSSANIVFLIGAFIGAVLIIPGKAGKALGFITLGMLLYRVGHVDLRDQIFGLYKPYLSEFANQIFPILFCTAGYIIILLCLLDRREKNRCLPNPDESVA